MKIAIAYYSRTGTTELVVNIMRKILKDLGTEVTIFRISPVREYSKPLHVNPRVLYDTLVKKGTNIILEPKEFKVEEYDMVIVASPIWFNTLPSPIQQFLKINANVISKFIVIAVSGLNVRCKRIIRIAESLAKVKPSICINVIASMAKNEVKLSQFIYEMAKKILS
ncbi:MAG: hypothetical protein QXZ41_00205 [Ignisphaera sp.]